MRDEEMYRKLEISRWSGSEGVTTLDQVVIEEPLEIRLNGQSLAVTMRTPGQDKELAAGFLLTEAIVRSREDIWDIQHCATQESPGMLNIVEVTVAPECVPDDLQTGRQRYSSSSCGICGKASIESIQRQFPVIANPPM